LSRDWHRPNLWRLSGEGGAICWDLDEWDKLELATGPAERASRVSIEELVGHERGATARPALTFEQAFADQLAALLNGEGEGAYVSAAEALPVLHIFERCDQVRTQMDMPWLA
jgi:predicted dehydrogenase